MKFDWVLGKRSVSEAQTKFSFTRRSFVVSGVQLGISALLAARMTWLSVFENERYALLAESNRVNLSLIPPRRGWIVDRAGHPLALNRTVFRVDIIPDRLVDKTATLDALTKILSLTPDERERIDKDIGPGTGYQPVQVAENLDWDKFAALSIRAPDLPGVVPAQGFSRFYPTGAAVGHLLGYVGSPSAEAYAKTRDPLYLTPGYKIGKDGIEKRMEDVLRGTPGARRSEVTARGKLVRPLATRADVPGETLHLTIDAGLQDYAARRLGDNSGAVTVIDCETGGILAMASMPAYDPNSFSDGIGRAEYAALTGDDHLPLVNKALQGLYPPGSTSKPMSSLAFLGAGIDPHATVNCGGAYRIGSSFFHCTARRGHGPIALEQAIIKSCDIYYYAMGLKAGIQPIADMFRTMGLGAEYMLPMPSQRFGTVPDPAWLKSKYKRDWEVYDTANSSIGQGFVLVNPMQLAVMASRIASGRDLIPHMMGNGGAGKPLNVDPAHLDFVRKAMGGVVNSGYGTASVARLPVAGVQMAGKTGTAQVRRISMAERAGGVIRNEALPWKFRDHALFVGFAPLVNPRYAISVIVEHGGFGAQAAAPVARDTMTYLFDPAKAMATLTAVEAGWGGDIATRMAKKAAGYALPESVPAPSSDNEQDTAQ
jgi:penicillin-binding protein 2